MSISELGKIVDYIFDKVRLKFPKVDVEDLYSLIYQGVKKHRIKDMDYKDFIKENNMFSHYAVWDFKRNKVIGVRDNNKQALEFKKELEQQDAFYKDRIKVVPVIPGKVQRGDRLSTRFILRNDIKEDFIFNVKPRRNATIPTPIVTALGIGRRIITRS